MFTTQTRISDIVKSHYQTAQVFEKHGLDFCCKGKRPLAEACEEKGFDTEQIFKELQDSVKDSGGADNHYEAWTADFLADYIVQQHHNFVRINSPLLQLHAEKVAMRHGDTHPENLEIRELVEAVVDEMREHMEKEENIVFPMVKKIAKGEPVEDFEKLINELESEHTSAGNAFERIRELSNNFMPPANACTTYKLLYAELDAFEKDLHKHVHLENNILFPKAIALSKTECVID